MLLDGQWESYAELIAYSEVYSVQIRIFNSIASGNFITRVTTTSGEKPIF